MHPPITREVGERPRLVGDRLDCRLDDCKALAHGGASAGVRLPQHANAPVLVMRACHGGVDEEVAPQRRGLRYSVLMPFVNWREPGFVSINATRSVRVLLKPRQSLELDGPAGRQDRRERHVPLRDFVILVRKRRLGINQTIVVVVVVRNERGGHFYRQADPVTSETAWLRVVQRATAQAIPAECAIIALPRCQLEDSQTIISEDLFTKEIEVLASYLDATEDARDLAKEWANKAEDSVVADGEYSAKHYAAKSSESATAASGSASSASGSASNASGSATAAANSATKANQWATKIDGKIDDTDYSAKHYASDSQEYAVGTRADGITPTHEQDNALYYKNLAADWAKKEGTSTVDGTYYSAKKYATDAESSASSASSSASSASASEAKAEKWADESEDVEVESGKYSAKQTRAAAPPDAGRRSAQAHHQSLLHPLGTLHTGTRLYPPH